MKRPPPPVRAPVVRAGGGLHPERRLALPPNPGGAAPDPTFRDGGNLLDSAAPQFFFADSVLAA